MAEGESKHHRLLHLGELPPLCSATPPPPIWGVV